MTKQKLTTPPLRALVICWVAGGFCLGGVAGVEAAGAESAGIFDDQAEAQSGTDGQEIKVGSFGQVDLHVKDLEVAQVLQLLSLQSQRNIIASRNVGGSISADLYGVDFYEALDAILHTNGFGYQEKGNLIFVYTSAELEVIEAAQRKVIHRIVRLNYITAADASAFVTPLLSPGGSLSISSEVGAGFQPSIGDGGANSFAHSDTLIIHDYAENVDEILAILKELDKRPKQVLVEATILQAGLIEKNGFGVDLSVLADFAVNKFLDPLGIVDDVISGATPISVPGHQGRGAASTTVGNTSAGLSGVKVGIVTHSVAAFIRALDDVTDTTVIANPKLLVLNRQKSDLLVGRKLGYLSSTATDTSTTQTVEFLEIGTQLTLRPFVSDDGFVRMELRPSVSDGNTNRTVGTFVIPETRNQEMTTNVVVRNGQTIVMGGLFKEDTTVSRRQVPGLGDIPILGALFKGQDDDVTRDEVIFLITPTIVKDEALYKMGDQVAGSVEIARLGAREGLLPWSHSKMIATHLRDAQKFYDQGDSQKAMWSANLALALDPTSIEAVRIKEQLTGKRLYAPAGFSILQDAVDDMIHNKIDAGRSQLNGRPGTTDTLDQRQGLLVPDGGVSPVAQDEQGVTPQAEFEGDIYPENPQQAQFEAAQVPPGQNVLEPDGQQDGGVDSGVWQWAKQALEPSNVADKPLDEVPATEAGAIVDDGAAAVTAIQQDDQPVADPVFEDVDDFTSWIESDPDADTQWQETVETQSVQESDPAAFPSEFSSFEAAVEPEGDRSVQELDPATFPSEFSSFEAAVEPEGDRSVQELDPATFPSEFSSFEAAVEPEGDRSVQELDPAAFPSEFSSFEAAVEPEGDRSVQELDPATFPSEFSSFEAAVEPEGDRSVQESDPAGFPSEFSSFEAAVEPEGDRSVQELDPATFPSEFSSFEAAAEPEDDQSAVFVPVVDEDQFVDEVDLDEADFEWDDEVSVTPAFDDEPLLEDSEVQFIADPEPSVATPANVVGQPGQLRFMDDQVESTDPFNAVVEWLMTTPDGQPEPGEEE